LGVRFVNSKRLHAKDLALNTLEAHLHADPTHIFTYIGHLSLLLLCPYSHSNKHICARNLLRLWGSVVRSVPANAIPVQKRTSHIRIRGMEEIVSCIPKSRASDTRTALMMTPTPPEPLSTSSVLCDRDHDRSYTGQFFAFIGSRTCGFIPAYGTPK